MKASRMIKGWSKLSVVKVNSLKCVQSIGNSYRFLKPANNAIMWSGCRTFSNVNLFKPIHNISERNTGLIFINNCCHVSSCSYPEVSAENILELIHTYQKTEVLLQAVAYNIFDILHEAGNNGMSNENIAKRLQVVPAHLERFLNACASLGLLIRYQHEDKQEVWFKNSREAEIYLTKTSPDSLVAYIELIKAFKPEFNLDTPIKTGKMIPVKLLEIPDRGEEDSNLYDHLQNEALLMFASSLAQTARTSFKMLSQLELAKFKITVDLGGSLGVMARELKHLHRNMDVILADLPPVIQHARQIPQNMEVDLNYAECDFFNKSTLPEANLYLLAHILHNWSDEACNTIIKNVYDSLTKGGAILVLGKVLNENLDGPAFVSMFDLAIMISFDGGKQRSFQQYKALLESHGFSDVTMKKHSSSPFYDSIMAYK